MLPLYPRFAKCQSILPFKSLTIPLLFVFLMKNLGASRRKNRKNSHAREAYPGCLGPRNSRSMEFSGTREALMGSNRIRRASKSRALR